MKYWIIYIILLVFTKYTASAQCPDRAEIYSRMNSVAENPDQNLATSGLNKLALLCRKCNAVNDSTYAKILHILGRTLWHENKLDSAILLTKQAIQVNSGKSVLVSEANLCHSYFNLACIYSDKGDLKMAVAALDNAIKRGLKFPEKMASVSGSYNKLANIYTSQGNYEKTLSSADIGYTYAEKANRKDLMAKSLMEKSQGLIELNRLEESEKVLSESLKMASEYENEALKGSIYSMLAELKKKQNKPAEVISYFHKSFNAFKKDGFGYGCGQAASNLGYYYEQKLHDFSKALEKSCNFCS